MSVGWQDAVAFGLVSVAAAIVIRHLWRASRGKRPPGCATCPARQAPLEPKRLISIDPPSKKK